MADYTNPNAALQIPSGQNPQGAQTPPPGVDAQGKSVWVSSPELNPTISVSGLSTVQTPTQIPTQPSVDTGAVANASIPTPKSIADASNAPTAADTQQSDLLNRIASLTGSQKSLTTQQVNAESAAGVPAFASTLRSLGAQLQGYNDQLSKLQVDASAGGTIQNQNQLNAEGRGITVGGNAPLLAGDLRKNQIQQASIATQALTTKAAYYAANNDYLNAKSAADQAAQVAFDATDQEIKHQQALLAAIQPTLTRQEATRAAVLQANLNAQATQVANQREDFKTGQALAIAAMKNNPNDTAAQFAAQQALKIDPKDPQYLQKVGDLVGKYQQNPLEIQKQIADLALTRAQTYKTNLEAKQIGGGTNTPPDISQLSTAQQSQLKSSGFSNYNTETQNLAIQAVTGNIAPSELSKRATGTSPYNKILVAADAYSMATTGKHFNIAIAQRDYNFANQQGTQNTLTYLTSLVGSPGNPGNLDTLLSTSKAVAAQPGSFNGAFVSGGSGSSFPALNDTTQWAKIQTGNAVLPGYYAQLLEVSDQIAKILQGGGTGSGTSDAKLAQAQGLFSKGFTVAQMQDVIESIKPLLANRGKAIIGDNPYLSDYKARLGYGGSNEPTDTSKGATWNNNGVNYVSDGTQWVKQ